jgi:hypothetical protein
MGNGNAEADIVGQGGLQEGDCALLCLIRHDLREGDPRGIIDADVDELPAEALATPAPIALAAAIAGDAVADAVDAAEFLGVDVQELARVLALIAADRLARLQCESAWIKPTYPGFPARWT